MPDSSIEFYLAIRSDIRIHAAASRIWECLDRPGAWKSSIVTVEHIDGRLGEEGELLRIAQRPGDETVMVLMHTVRLERPIWRVQTLTTEGSRATDGFVIYSLYPAGVTTNLVCEVVARCAIPAERIGDATAEDFARGVNDSTRQKLDADLRELKSHAESAG